MQSKVLSSIPEAVADIPDGSSIMVGGFVTTGTPFNLVRALYYQGARDLTLIANGGTNRPAREDLRTTSDLIAEGRMRKVILAFTASTHPSQFSIIERLNQEGTLEAELVPQGTLAERMRAGGAGIPAFYTPAAVGTELAEGRETRDFNGRTYLLEEALTADYAFVKAWKADEFGNLIYRSTARNFNPLMAMAARCTIVEAEEIVPAGSLNPDQIHTPGIYVQRIVQIPPPPEGIWEVSLRDVAAPRVKSEAPS